MAERVKTLHVKCRQAKRRKIKSCMFKYFRYHMSVTETMLTETLKHMRIFLFACRRLACNIFTSQ